MCTICISPSSGTIFPHIFRHPDRSLFSAGGVQQLRCDRRLCAPHGRQPGGGVRQGDMPPPPPRAPHHLEGGGHNINVPHLVEHLYHEAQVLHCVRPNPVSRHGGKGWQHFWRLGTINCPPQNWPKITPQSILNGILSRPLSGPEPHAIEASHTNGPSVTDLHLPHNMWRAG